MSPLNWNEKAKQKTRERERERVYCTHNREVRRYALLFNVHFYCRQLRRYIFRRYICIYNWQYNTHIHAERERENTHKSKSERERVFLREYFSAGDPFFFFLARRNAAESRPSLACSFPMLLSNKCAMLVSSRPNLLTLLHISSFLECISFLCRDFSTRHASTTILKPAPYAKLCPNRIWNVDLQRVCRHFRRLFASFYKKFVIKSVTKKRTRFLWPRRVDESIPKHFIWEGLLMTISFVSLYFRIIVIIRRFSSTIFLQFVEFKVTRRSFGNVKAPTHVAIHKSTLRLSRNLTSVSIYLRILLDWSISTTRVSKHGIVFQLILLSSIIRGAELEKSRIIANVRNTKWIWNESF